MFQKLFHFMSQKPPLSFHFEASSMHPSASLLPSLPVKPTILHPFFHPNPVTVLVDRVVR